MSPEQLFLEQCSLSDPQPYYVSPLDSLMDTADILEARKLITRLPEQSIGGQWFIGYKLTPAGYRAEQQQRKASNATTD